MEGAIEAQQSATERALTVICMNSTIVLDHRVDHFLRSASVYVQMGLLFNSFVCCMHTQQKCSFIHIVEVVDFKIHYTCSYTILLVSRTVANVTITTTTLYHYYYYHCYHHSRHFCYHRLHF